MVRSQWEIRLDGWTSGSAWTSLHPTMQCLAGGRLPGRCLWETSERMSLSSAASKHKQLRLLHVPHPDNLHLTWSCRVTHRSLLSQDGIFSIIWEDGCPLSSFIDDTVLVTAVWVLNPVTHITLNRKPEIRNQIHFQINWDREIIE